MSLAASIASFATGPYSVSRPGTDTYDADGKLVVGSPSSFSAPMVVQPVSGKALQRLPEGMRERAELMLWSTTELRNKDLVTIAGVQYELEVLKDWSVLGSYYQAAALKIGRT